MRLVFSIIANEALFWYTLLVSRRINSELLRANAWHHRTDAISSVVVLVGIGGTLLGYVYLDLVAALIVGVMVAKIGWDLGWGAMRELVDAALDEDTVDQIRQIINDIDGVRSIQMLRTRPRDMRPWRMFTYWWRRGYQYPRDTSSVEVENRIKRGIAEMTDVVVQITGR